MHTDNDSLREFAALIGVENNSTTHKEKLIATLGALLGILAVSIISLSVTSGTTAGLMIASMGASAVLLFVVPHGALSQPWPVFAGHLLSGAIGVLCYQLFPEQIWTPALAVCLAIALVFNNFFHWRRYPAHLMKKQYAESTAAMAAKLELTQEDFEAAMQKMNTFIDVSTEELIELVDLARQHAEEHRAHPAGIVPGHHYSNGRLGRFWSVRQVIDQGPGKIIYKAVAGDGLWDTGICGYEEFRLWARFEVELREGRWVKVRENQ